MKPALRRSVKRHLKFDIDALGNVELAWLSGVSALALAGVLWLFLGWYAPPPKNTLTIAAGPSTGAYFQYALRYQERLAAHGVHAEVLETNGTIENFERLTDTGERSADIAFMQAGPWDTKRAELQSLAAVGMEPIWVFIDPHRFAPKQLSDLRGRRVAVGQEGSGTLPVAQALLRLADIGPDDVQARTIGGKAALEALRNGEVSATFMVASAAAPIVEQAIGMGLQVLAFSNATAFERRLPWSHAITLARGLMSVAHDMPSADLRMLAVNTNLVSRSGLHESMKFLLLDVATQVHADAGLLHGARQYPSADGLLFAQGEASKDFFRGGQPWLNKFLPFWSAHQINRLLLSLLPVLVIALPLLRAVIAFNERRNRAAIMRLHTQAKEMEFGLSGERGGAADTQQAVLLLARKLQKLTPLTIHSVDYFHVHESLRRLQTAGRPRVDTGLAATSASSEVHPLAGAPEVMHLKVVPSAAPAGSRDASGRQEG
jgi:NMT1-like family